MARLRLSLAAVISLLLFAVRIAIVLAEGNDGDELRFYPAPIPGYALFEDTDASNYADDNAQAVYLVAPSIIPNSPLGTFFLNNVMTDGDYFIQTGLSFRNGTGNVVWTDDANGLTPRLYPRTLYVPSHTYRFTVTYTSGLWWMCVYDATISTLFTTGHFLT